MTDPQKDEHIEELLSKLQGIFGKLSHSEEEEAKQAQEVPGSSKAPEPKNEPPPVPKSASPNPINLYAEPEAKPAQAPELPASELPEPAPRAAAATNTQGAYESMVPTEDPERIIIPTAIYFPPGKEAEAKVLAQKLETMTPKFTKVAFRLRVIVFLPYDPKSDWKEALLIKAAETNFQTVFVAVDRMMEDSKKKAIAAELEGKNIYLQEVPIPSIEKKAFYTDILLGLVFFFDSRKPPAPAEGSGA